MLELKDIWKTYEGRPLLRGISFVARAGETLCLLGASGSGKSTLLRMIAGLEAPDAGQILWAAQDLAFTPPHLRDFGLVFQDYALFPHLDVFDNVAFGLKMKNRPRLEIERRVGDVLDLVNLRGFEGRNVTDLSGGEQQRVALGRALAARPRLLMFDEPLGALDRTLKEGLLGELHLILRTAGVPAIYVTHDQEEAFTIAGRVLLLHEGRIVREGSPAEVWKQPGSAWAAEFLGSGNVIQGLKAEGGQVETQLGAFNVKCGHAHRAGEQVHLLVRPGEVRDGNAFEGVVTDVIFQPDRFKVALDNGLFVYLSEAPRIGSRMGVRLAVECLG
jgi:ABC-type Fe3+/spermidine/putrescine transport system ATPase subunit